MLFEAETRDLAFCAFKIESIDERRATGWASGFPSADFELWGPPVKAVTYHELVIATTPGGYSAQIVFDV